MLDVLNEEDEVLEFNRLEDKPRESKYSYDDRIVTATCTSVEPGTTAAGAPKLVLGFTIGDGPGAGVAIQMHVVEKVIHIAEKAAKALGYEQDRTKPKSQFPKSKLVGKPCRLDLRKESFNGKDRMKIFAVLPPESTGL